MESRRIRSTANLMDFLNDVDYPATKDEIIALAEDHMVSHDIMGRLKQMPNRTYISLADATDEVPV
ncbi:MAG: DUF2795 domain-containing protein [Armatimonadota bacterium]|nr:DUF2795 domain-containing protein [bacterium]